jgi:hypothetical protein
VRRFRQHREREQRERGMDQADASMVVHDGAGY